MSVLIALNIVGDSYLERLTCLAAVLLTMYDANPSIDLTSPFSNSLPISTKQVCSKDVKSGILCQIVFPILSTISTTFGYRTAFSMNIKFSFFINLFSSSFPSYYRRGQDSMFLGHSFKKNIFVPRLGFYYTIFLLKSNYYFLNSIVDFRIYV